MKKNKKLVILALATTMFISMAGCNKSLNGNQTVDVSDEVVEVVDNNVEQETNTSTSTNTSTVEETVVNVSAKSTSALDVENIFTTRDLKQLADTSNATYYTLSDNNTITITEEGVYVLTGTAKEAQVIVEADDNAKVQLVLDGVNVTNSSSPVIYVKNADKVFITLTESDNYMAVTGSFTADGTTNLDAVIYSKDDLTLSGKGTLTIKSSVNGITSNDDLKISGGTYNITASGGHGLEGKESLSVYDGTFTINAGTDGLHTSETADSTKGYIYIYGGSFNITAKSDGVQSITVLQIDGGNLKISAGEGLESTHVQINGGTVSISASDDGINATQKSTALKACLEINGGDITVNMAQGDTDALDSNGNLVITGGTLNISAQFAFDFDGSVTFTGGEVYVNGSKVTSISNSMMGCGGMGGPGGNMGRPGGFGGR